MYKKPNQAPISSSIPIKKGSKAPERAVSSLNDRKNQTNSNQFKSKDQQLFNYVKEYLQLNGYNRTYQAFKSQKPIQRIKSQSSNHKNHDAEIKNVILAAYDKGAREEFFKHSNKYFNTTEEGIKRFQFELQIYFCIFCIHPNCNKKLVNIDKASSEAFKKYLDTKGADLSSTSQFLNFFALPFMPKPQEHPALAHIFKKQWIAKIRSKLVEFLAIHLKGSNLGFANNNPSNNQSSTYKKISPLQEMFYNSTSYSSIESNSRDQCKENCTHSIENHDLKEQIRDLRIIIENIQSKFKQFSQSSKINLIQSNTKWFNFSKELLILIKKAEKGQKIKQLQKYQRFFGVGVDDLMDANQISLFDRNSYLGDEISMVPSTSKNKAIKKPESTSNCQIDMNKIRVLLLQAHDKERQVQICVVLKALKDRFIKIRQSIHRRQIIIQYARNDICGINEQNYQVQAKLLLESPPKVKQFYLRFMNYISTDIFGIQYLTKSKKLIQNLVIIFNSEDQYSGSRKSVLGILQRFSFCKVPRLQLISSGMVDIICKIFRTEKEELSDFTIQYCTALMMNLSLERCSKGDFERNRHQIMPLLIQLIDSQNTHIKDYVNGTLYLLLTSKLMQQQARKCKLVELVSELLESKPDDVCCPQYNYILKRLTGEEEEMGEDENDSEDEEECEIQDLEDEEDSPLSESSASSEYIDGEFDYLNGEEFLMKEYALLGPEAVREQMLTRSVLDQTSKRLNNMTTSINHSRRMDNIFVHKQNNTVLGPELDTLLNRNPKKNP